MAELYRVYNAAVPTTAVMTAVSTGTSIKTLLQVTAPSAPRITLVKWGIEFDGAPSAIRAELINTTTVAGGSPTAVTPTVMRDGSPPSLCTAGFSPSSEGSIVATCKVFDTHILSANSFAYEWSLGREVVLGASQVVRIRVLAAAAVNAICFLEYEE